MNQSTRTDQEWFFYIVRCKDNSLYSGITIDLEHRLKEHNNGTGAKYTAARRPVTLVYYEKYGNISEARKREIQVKSWGRNKKEQLIEGSCGFSLGYARDKPLDRARGKRILPSPL